MKTTQEKIVAIGGGKLAEHETLKIDQEIVRLTGKRKPNALFIPTASSDSEEYWEFFHAVYGRKLGCRTDVLWLLRETPAPKICREKILSADLIYVGGGNTLKMMRRWRWLGVDKLLRRSLKNGTVLAGLSAGCICWFEWGHSDSMAFYHPEDWDYVRVKGMGFINALGCSHYHAEKREENFRAMVKRNGDIGLAMDNNCALEVINGKYRVITSQKGVNAYRVHRHRGKVFQEIIEQKKKYEPLEFLVSPCSSST